MVQCCKTIKFTKKKKPYRNAYSCEVVSMDAPGGVAGKGSCREPSPVRTTCTDNASHDRIYWDKLWGDISISTGISISISFSFQLFSYVDSRV